MSNDFEVLPVGSMNELIVIRKLLTQLLEQDAVADATGVKETISEIRDYYKSVV